MLDISHHFRPVKKVSKLVREIGIFRCPRHGLFHFGYTLPPEGCSAPGLYSNIPCFNLRCGRSSAHVGDRIKLVDVWVL